MTQTTLRASGGVPADAGGTDGTARQVDLPADALLATKLYLPPPRPDRVPRPRLTARLDAGLRGPLTLLVAPAGWGKTTLLGDWHAARHDASPEGVQAAPWPLAWLSLDTGDNDPVRFLRYLVAALRTLRTEIGSAILASLRSPAPPSVEALLTPLLNDLATLPDDVILVLDDYHVIETPTIHQALAFLLDHLPPRMHLILATRADPPLPLARLRARGQLAELRAADLHFTSDEAAAFLTSTMGLPLSAQEVEMLESCTEGWIAGLHLAALALRGRDPAPLIAAYRGTHRYIVDFLGDEVFARQPADMQRFLLYTSVLDRLSGPLCDAVMGAASQAADAAACESSSGGGQHLLERLEAANLFLMPLDATRTWYRYHHLFAGFLRERLRRQDPNLIPTLHRRAYQWLEQHGLMASAADHALDAGDGMQAARLIERTIGPMIWQRGELATPLRWLDRLPREVVRGRPRLCLDLAWVLLWSAQIDAIEPRLQDAEYALDSAGDAAASGPDVAPALRGEIAVLRAEVARQRGELGAAIALARQALDGLPADDRRARGVTTGLLGGAYLSSGDAAAASHAYAETVALSQTLDTITLALIASGRLVLAQALDGRLHQAAETYRQTLDLAATYGMAATPTLGVAHVGMGEVLREWNDLGRAEELLRQGIAHCADAYGLAEMALDGSIALARVFQARGDVEGALAVLTHAEAIGRGGQVVQSAARVGAARARLWLTARPGDVAAATRWSDAHAGTRRSDDQLDYLGLLERLTLARLRLAQGRRAEAAALLPSLLGRAEAGGLTGAVLEVLVLQARLYHEGGDTIQAMIALSRALALAEPEGYMRVFVDEGVPMVALLRQAQARGVVPAYVATLLAACGATGTLTTPSALELIEPLSARELELLRLLASGLSTSEIAARLFITTGTARNHLKSIYGKLAVHSRLQAVERARALGLL